MDILYIYSQSANEWLSAWYGVHFYTWKEQRFRVGPIAVVLKSSFQGNIFYGGPNLMCHVQAMKASAVFLTSLPPRLKCYFSL